MRVIPANEVIDTDIESDDDFDILERKNPLRVIPYHQIDEQQRTLYAEFMEHCGTRPYVTPKNENKPHPVMVEMRKVQEEINALKKAKIKSGLKRQIANRLQNEFRAYLRHQNIRYRGIWNDLSIPKFN